MRQASKRIPESAEKTVRDIRRATRRHHSAEEKIRIVLEGLRGEDSIAELCRKEGINQNLYYRWSKEFLEAGKERLAGDTAREATSDEVKELKAEARQLKETLAEVLIENRLLKKKRSRGWGGHFMRYSASEKFEIIELVEQSSLSIRYGPICDICSAADGCVEQATKPKLLFSRRLPYFGTCRLRPGRAIAGASQSVPQDRKFSRIVSVMGCLGP